MRRGGFFRFFLAGSEARLHFDGAVAFDAAPGAQLLVERQDDQPKVDHHQDLRGNHLINIRNPYKASPREGG